jgi:TP901 family phage tail tape measure protein
MDKMFGLGVLLTAKDMMSPVLNDADGKIGSIGERVKNLSKSMAAMGTASYAAGQSILKPIGDTVFAYQELASAQGEIASLGIGASGIDAITKSAKEFSNQFAGGTATDFVRASYDIKSGISSLSDTAVGEFTKTAAMTAAATKSSTDLMTSLFASGFDIYRKQFSEFGASTIQGWHALSDEEKDIKFGEYFSAGIASSVQAFKTDGQNMNDAISNLGATATSAGISFAEQLSILGKLQGSMSGSEAATKYRAFLNSVTGAGEKLGLSFTDANDNMLSMPDVINQIKDKYGETIDALEAQELKKAFGTDEAVALVKLLYNETDNLTESINGMGKSLKNGTELTFEMALAMNKGKEFELLGNQVNNLSTSIGKIFAPAAVFVGQAIGSIATGIGDFVDEYPNLSGVIGGAIAGLGVLLTVGGSVAIGLSALGAIAPFVSGGFGLMAGSIKLLGAAFYGVPIIGWIAGIATAATLIYTYWEPISGFFSSLWGGISSLFDSVWEGVKTALSFSPLGLIIKSWGVVFDWFSDKFDFLGKGVEKLKDIGKSLAGIFGFGDDEDKKDQKVGDAVNNTNYKQDDYKALGDAVGSVDQPKIKDVMREHSAPKVGDAVNNTNYKQDDYKALGDAVGSVDQPKIKDVMREHSAPKVGDAVNYEANKPEEPKSIVNNDSYQESYQTQSSSASYSIEININNPKLEDSTDIKAMEIQIESAIEEALERIESKRRDNSFEDVA